MAYTVQNFKSKAAIKRALADKVEIGVFQLGPWGDVPKDGPVSLEGPHYPQPHSWWGTGTMKDGLLVSIK